MEARGLSRCVREIRKPRPPIPRAQVKGNDVTWNYRIIDHGEWLALHEVYYDEAGNPRSYTSEPCTFFAHDDEGADGVIRSLEMAFSCAKSLAVLPISVFSEEG